MKDLGLTQNYLGIDFLHIDSSLLLHQQSYILKLLQDTGMLDLCPEYTPLPLGHTLYSNTGTLAVDVFDYCHVMGKLIFLIHLCPDISYAVGVVSRYISKPQQSHWDSMLHILCYLNQTCDLGVFYSVGPTHLESFTHVGYLS